MNYQINEVDIVEGKITYTVDGNEVTEDLTLTSLINAIIKFINALLKFEF